jgi:hypothetical protein
VLGALMVGAIGMSGVTLVGCGETSETKTEIKQSTPQGSTDETVTSRVKQTGEAPPPPTGGTGAPAPKP